MSASPPVDPPSQTPRVGIGPVIVLVLACAVFIGTLTGLTSSFLGIEYVDHYGTQWFYWYAEHQLRNLEGFGHTNLLFYPYGKDIYLHTGSNILDAVLAVPFRVIFGHVLGYNLFVLAALAASGAAFGLLARDLTEDSAAIWISAALVTLSPYVLSEVAEGRPTQAFLAFPALYLREVLRTGDRRGLRAPILAGLWLALSGYQYWYYAFFGGMVALAHGLWRTASPAEGAGGRARTLGRHALIAAVALALTLPATWSLLQSTASGEVPGLLDVSAWSEGAIAPKTHEGESVGMFLWQAIRGQSGFLAGSDPDSLQFLAQGVFTPWLAMIAAGMAMLRPGRLQRGPWIAMALTATVIAAGPVWLLDDGWVPNPPYVTLVEHLPFLQRLWWPSRAYAFMNLLYGMAIAVSLGWVATLGRRALVGTAALGALSWAWQLHAGLLLPFPTWDATVPAGYQCLADGEPGAILELPFSWTQAHLYWQTVHERPMLGGMLENNSVFAPEEAVKLREDNTFVAALVQLARSEGTTTMNWTASDREAVGALGYKYVVLQRDAYAVPVERPGLVDNALKARLRRMRGQLAQMMGPPVYEDARVNIYAPWGAPSPCATDAVTLDTAPLGNTEATHGLRRDAPPGNTRLRPIFKIPTTTDNTGSTVAPEASIPSPAEATPADKP